MAAVSKDYPRVGAGTMAGTMLKVEYHVDVRGENMIYLMQFGAANKYAVHGDYSGVHITKGWFGGFYVGRYEFDTRNNAERFIKVFEFLNRKYERLQWYWREYKARHIADLLADEAKVPRITGNATSELKRDLDALREEFEEFGFKVYECYLGF